MTAHDTTAPSGDAPDPDLPMLTTAEATRLRALAAPYADERHRLRNLAQICRAAPEDHWPALVERHFAHLRQAGSGDEDVEDLLRGVHPRLLPAGAFAPEMAQAMTYAREVAGQLWLTLCHDAPTSVRTLTDRDMARVGFERLVEAAFANLSRVPVEHVEVPTHDGVVLHSVRGDSFFVGSMALVLDDLARAVTGRDLPPAGALVVLPTRHLLAFQPLDDATAVEGLNQLARYALAAFQDGPGSLSPRVFWWHEGRLTSLTVVDDERASLRLEPPPELVDLLRDLLRTDVAGREADPDSLNRGG